MPKASGSKCIFGEHITTFIECLDVAVIALEGGVGGARGKEQCSTTEKMLS